MDKDHLHFLPDRVPEPILEDLKVRCCFVTKLERGHMIQAVAQGKDDKLPEPTPAGAQYPLDGGKILFMPGKLRSVERNSLCSCTPMTQIKARLSSFSFE